MQKNLNFLNVSTCVFMVKKLKFFSEGLKLFKSFFVMVSNECINIYIYIYIYISELNS